MKNNHNILLIRLLEFAILFAITSCSANTSELSKNPTLIIDTSELPSALKNQHIYFYSLVKENVYITTIDRNKEFNIKLKGNDLALSFSGQYLTYSTFDKIYVINTHTGEKNIVIDLKTDIPYAKYVGSPSISFDDKSLIFRFELSNNEFRLGVLDMEKDELRILDGDGFNDKPKFSVSGDKIFSVCEGDDIVGFEVCIMNNNGGNRKHLTNVEGYHWLWISPDGEHIVVLQQKTRWIGRNLASLYVMDFNGENIIPLVEWQAFVLTFSKDGKNVVFCKSTQDGSCEGVYVIGLDGNNLMHLTYFDDEFFDQLK